MKVVLFCGGMGMRMRDYSEDIPKPLVPVGYRPILWHVMKYYAHFGHKEFILCLGYKADVIKKYFLNYDECLSNDFVLTKGGDRLDLLTSDIQDWKITFVDTGLHSNIGMRLKAVQSYVQDDEMFLANYTDGVTDLPLNAHIDRFRESGKVGAFAAVAPIQSFHVVAMEEDDATVKSINHLTRSGLWINGGYFVFRPEIFDYIEEGDELVEAPFQRLIERKQLLAHRYEGFWANMDTFKAKRMLEELFFQGKAPWQLWSGHGG